MEATFTTIRVSFSLVLQALVDAEYRFLSADVGASRSSSDAYIFNSCKLKKNIEDGKLGFPPPESLREGGPPLHYFLLGDDTYALKPWLVKPYNRRLCLEYYLADSGSYSTQCSKNQRLIESEY